MPFLLLPENKLFFQGKHSTNSPKQISPPPPPDLLLARRPAGRPPQPAVGAASGLPDHVMGRPTELPPTEGRRIPNPGRLRLGSSVLSAAAAAGETSIFHLIHSNDRITNQLARSSLHYP